MVTQKNSDGKKLIIEDDIANMNFLRRHRTCILQNAKITL